VGLPPLVGFLVAGFVLNAWGVEGGESLKDFGDFGVTLLPDSVRFLGRERRAEVRARRRQHATSISDASRELDC
jgi:hypothetical protein